MKKALTAVFITSFLLVINTLNSAYVSAESINDAQNKINKLEKEQQEVKDKQGNIHNDKKATEDKINKNKKKQKATEQDLNAITKELNETKSKIETKEAEIVKTDQEIEALHEMIGALKKDIEILIDRIEKRELLIKDRLRSMQKSGGNVGFIEVIFGSKNFSEFISRTSAVSTIMDQDKSIMDAQTADKIELEDKKVEVEVKKKTIEAKKVALEDQKKELSVLKDQLDEKAKEKKTLIAQLEKEHEKLEEYNVSLDEEKEILAAQASALEKAKKLAINEKNNLEQLAKEQAAREKAAKETTKSDSAASPSTGNKNGIFSWPAQGRISSHYGWRTHPIFGTKKLHAGTDIAVGTGTPLKAAASGVVSTARAMGGYGNVIMITHVIDGKTYTTVYAHLNSISVSPGQAVSEGQVIGATGNTGNSTGPHLHFEVYIGEWSNSKGNTVNPLNYLK